MKEKREESWTAERSTTIERLKDSVYTVRNFFTPAECAAYIELSEQIGFDAAPLTTAAGPLLRPDVRNNTRVMLDDAARASDLWRRAAPYVEKWEERWAPIGLNERLRFYRYDVGQQFDWHYDGYFQRSRNERSWLTFLIYLNSDYQGGETSFGDVVVRPATGMALFFVHHVLHKGMPVARGRKYVVRSDVMFRVTDD